MPTHDYEKQVEQIMERVEASDEIHDNNKEKIQEYHRDLKLDGIAPATQQKYLAYLVVVGKHVGTTHFEDMDKDDVKDLVAWVQSKDHAPSTVDTYKEIIRQFWSWLRGKDAKGEYPDEVAWIKVDTKRSSGKLPSDLLTKEDVEKQIEACHNARDKALIAILWETGARIGELIDVTVGDIEDRKHGMKITIDGKTGSRRLPLVESVPYLNKWLNEHPNPTKDAPLWCKIQQGTPDDQLGYRYIRSKVLERSMDDAEIDKPSNPHHYRHSRASHLATKMTEAELCEWFGWVQGSDVPAKYVHLSGRDIDNKYDAMHGIVDEEEDEEEPNVVECPRCDELNEPDAAFCYKCGFALTDDARDDVDTLEVDTAEAAEPEDVDVAQKLMAKLSEAGVDTDDLLEAVDGE
jgi:integrase